MNIWSRLGLSVGIAAIFCITVIEVFQDKTYYQSLRWYVLASLITGGLLLGLVGWRLWGRGKGLLAAALSNKDPLADTPPPPPELAVASHFVFWGPILIIFAVVIFFLPYREKPRPAVAREVAVEKKPEPEPPPVPPPVVEVEPPKAVKFPDLKIQGFVYRPPRPAIIIDRKSYFVGDVYENAEIVEIDASSVTLQVDGQRKIVLLDSSR